MEDKTISVPAMPATPAALPARVILSLPVHATTYAGAVHRIAQWAANRESRAVFAANVHTVMLAQDSPAFLHAARSADLITADGMPLVWGLRALGVAGATRVYGPDLTIHTLDFAARRDIPVAFYGSDPYTLDRLLDAVRRRWPAVRVVYSCAPPFRDLTADEDAAIARRIRHAAPRILFVGLGCPRQEHWIAAHRGTLPCVMLGVGAAFDFLAGTKPQAPRWMMRSGLEWLFRLTTEPRRLWRRYLWNSPRFVALFALQLLGSRRPARSRK